MAEKCVKTGAVLAHGINLNLSGIHQTAAGNYEGGIEHWQFVALYGILQELKKLNTLLGCPNFIGIPRTLHMISKNTTKPRKRKPKVKP